MAKQLPPSISKLIEEKWHGAAKFFDEPPDAEERAETAIRNLLLVRAAAERSLTNLPSSVPAAPSASIPETALPSVLGLHPQPDPLNPGTGTSLHRGSGGLHTEHGLGAGKHTGRLGSKPFAPRVWKLLPVVVAALVLVGLARCR